MFQSTQGFGQIKAEWGRFLPDKCIRLREQLLKCHYKVVNRYLKLLVPLEQQGVGSSRGLQLCITLPLSNQFEDQFSTVFFTNECRATLDTDWWSGGWLENGDHVPKRLQRQEGDGMFSVGIMGRNLISPFQVLEGVNMTSVKDLVFHAFYVFILKKNKTTYYWEVCSLTFKLKPQGWWLENCNDCHWYWLFSKTREKCNLHTSATSGWMLIIYDSSVWKIMNEVVRNNIVNRFHCTLTDINLNGFSVIGKKKWHIIFLFLISWLKDKLLF